MAGAFAGGRMVMHWQKADLAPGYTFLSSDPSHSLRNESMNRQQLQGPAPDFAVNSKFVADAAHGAAGADLCKRPDLCKN
jgi:hypothetical protein